MLRGALHDRTNESSATVIIRSLSLAYGPGLVRIQVSCTSCGAWYSWKLATATIYNLFIETLMQTISPMISLVTDYLLSFQRFRGQTTLKPNCLVSCWRSYWISLPIGHRLLGSFDSPLLSTRTSPGYPENVSGSHETVSYVLSKV